MAVRGPIKLKAVQPFIPAEKERQQQLAEDLEIMGCESLMRLPWCLKDASMVAEILDGAGNQFEGTIRARPREWKVETWRAVYQFKGTSGNGLCGHKQKHAQRMFSRRPNKHDGFAVTDCINDQARACMAFLQLAPVFHPQKPHRLTVKLAHTLMGAWTKEREVDSGVLMRDTLLRLVDGIGKTRPTPISPLLFHLYRHTELLTDAEEQEYMAREIWTKPEW